MVTTISEHAAKIQTRDQNHEVEVICGTMAVNGPVSRTIDLTVCCPQMTPFPFWYAIFCHSGYQRRKDKRYSPVSVGDTLRDTVRIR